MLDPALAWVLRIALSALLLRAAFHKARDPQAFGESLRAYEIVPTRLSDGAAHGLIALEALLALCLWLPPVAAAAALGTATLIACYGVAIAWNLARGRRSLDCGCFGPGQRQSISEWMLVRNLLWVATGAIAALPQSARALHWLDAPTALVGGLCLALLAATLEQLVALSSPTGRSA